MRIRNSRNPIDVPETIHSGPSTVHAPLSGAFPAERPRPQPPPAPELGVCVVNKSPWDVTPLVLAFFHADGLLQLQQRCPSRYDKNDGDFHQKPSKQGASALEEKLGQFRSDTLSPCISSIKPCGNEWRRGKGKQEGKRSKALCPNSEGLAVDPITIPQSPQNSRRRSAKKREDEGSPATRGKGGTDGVKSRTCKREDGKGWRCSNEAAPGSTHCEHHLSQVRSYCKRPSNDSSKRRTPSIAEAGEGRRKRPITQSSSTTTLVGNDCYYYYYTGFGPAWRETKRKKVSAIAEVDGTDDDDDGGGAGAGGGNGVDAAAAGRVSGEGDEDGGKGKIKGRKRVKCRSLKSLL